MIDNTRHHNLSTWISSTIMRNFLLAFLFVFLALPYIAISLGDSFTEQIPSADNSSIPWRRAKLSYRIAKISPIFWHTSDTHEQQTDILLSDHFFVQVLRGEQDAIVPQNHLDFLADRPETSEWLKIRLHTLLQYGQFTEALTLAQKHAQKLVGAENILATASVFTGDMSILQNICATWTDCPVGWHGTADKMVSALSVDQEISIQSDVSPENLSIMLEWKASQHTLSTEEQAYLDGQSDIRFQCARLASLEFMEATIQQAQLDEILGNIYQQNLLLSYGTMVQQTLCHADRFTKALSYARADQEPLLRLLLAHTHTTQFNVTPAQKELKILQEFIEQPENTAYAKLWYHLRFLNRLVAGDPAGMDKYAEQGMPLDKALFSIHLGQSKLYQQEKTTAIQLLSNLNGYPIETVLAAEYTDMLVFSKRLNGSATKIQIGGEELAYDFMDNDGNFRAWLVQYMANNLDTTKGTPMTIALLRFWRGEDKHSDQLIQTHLEQYVTPWSVVFSTHQRYLESSVRTDKILAKTAWNNFADTRQWLDTLPFPQMLRTHPELFRTAFPR